MLSETAPAIDVEGEFRRTIRDVGLLIEFLGQQADSRLQAHFEDTRGHLSSPVRTLGVPPCRTYRHFLNRLVAIGGPLPGLPIEGRRRLRHRTPRTKATKASTTLPSSISAAIFWPQWPLRPRWRPSVSPAPIKPPVAIRFSPIFAADSVETSRAPRAREPARRRPAAMSAPLARGVSHFGLSALNTALSC